MGQWASWRFTISIALVCALAWLAYLPGLQGGFLFDDWVNLDALGAYGPVDNWATFWRYITAGTADPTGRPLALLSFLLDARDWPAEPLSFKRTNVLLHLLNGALLAVFMRQLGRVSFVQSNPRRIDIAAILGASLWLLHPLLVSTTLYVVQREAMLPATFTLLGLMGYVNGYKRLCAGRSSGAYLAIGAIAVCTLLATASKANGALLPLLALVVDRVFLIAQPTDERTAMKLRWTRFGVLLAPSLLILGYLAFMAVLGLASDAMPQGRPWTIHERLLTQARVILDYLQLLFLPQPYSNGLFNDQIAVSHGLLAPISTLWSVLALIALIVGALLLRTRLPILAGALLFYFCGQVMESSVLPLELSFEHRNYLPALMLFWPLGWWLAQAWAPAQRSDTLTILFRGLGIGLPLLLAGLTWLRSDLWGNATEQALLWARMNPNSARAQAFAAQTETRLGHPDRAIVRLRDAMTSMPADVQLTVNLADAWCAQGALPIEAEQSLANVLEDATRGETLVFGWLNRKLDAAELHPLRPCPDPEQLHNLVRAWSRNPAVETASGRRADTFHLEGRLHLLAGDAAAALTSFNAALRIGPTPAKALRQAALLANAGFPSLGLQHLAAYAAIDEKQANERVGMSWLHQKLLERQGYWQDELRQLRKALEAEAAKEGGGLSA